MNLGTFRFPETSHICLCILLKNTKTYISIHVNNYSLQTLLRNPKRKAFLGPPQCLGWTSFKHLLMVFLSSTILAGSFVLEVGRVLDPALKKGLFI